MDLEVFKMPTLSEGFSQLQILVYVYAHIQQHIGKLSQVIDRPMGALTASGV